VDFHVSTECEEYWRNRFADQIEEAIARDWGLSPDDPDFQTVRWFREGAKYASIIVRWAYDDEASDDQT
jgi:hypothetical protein